MSELIPTNRESGDSQAWEKLISFRSSREQLVQIDFGFSG